MDIDPHSVTELEHLNSYKIADSFLLCRYAAGHQFQPTFHRFFLPLLLYTVLFGGNSSLCLPKRANRNCL